MTKYIFYTAGSNERWDLLAYMFYKNCYKMKPIIEANPHIPITPEIKEGTVIKIPVSEKIT
ncbi:MAG: tail protein X, partial [Candidatus Gastranaerophilaceae bacterium]